MENDSLSKMLQAVNTREEMVDFLDELDKAKAAIYKGDETANLSNKLDKKVSNIFLDNLKNWENEGLVPVNPKEREEFLEKLKTFLESLPQIKLTLAFKPDADFVKKISTILSSKTGQKPILDLDVKEDILGGVLFEYQGEFRDYSISKEIDQVLENVKLNY